MEWSMYRDGCLSNHNESDQERNRHFHEMSAAHRFKVAVSPGCWNRSSANSFSICKGTTRACSRRPPSQSHYSRERDMSPLPEKRRTRIVQEGANSRRAISQLPPATAGPAVPGAEELDSAALWCCSWRYGTTIAPP